MICEEIKEKYTLLKEKNIDNLLIKIGIGGVLVGLALALPIINQIFAWFILFGCGMKLYDFVLDTQSKLDTNKEDTKTLTVEIKEKYTLFKEKKGDNLLIKVGIVGVVIGLIFSISIINQIFAWIILFGVAFKLYDFVVDTKNNIVA